MDAHHSAGAAKRRVRPESDRETSPLAGPRLVSRSDSAEPAGLRCRPAAEW